MVTKLGCLTPSCLAPVSKGPYQKRDPTVNSAPVASN